MKVTKEVEKSLEGINEDEFKRVMRRYYRAKHESEANAPHSPKIVAKEGVEPNVSSDGMRYYEPKKQDLRIGRESYEGHTSLTDKLGYMPLLDRLLQMQRGGESLSQFRTYMAEYNVELRKSMEEAAKLSVEEWPVALPTYMPEPAQLQAMAREAQYRAAARVKVAQEEAYRKIAMQKSQEASASSPGASGASTECI